eukprot:CCRYP_000677-RA/>CCRYP_000677-RA protein AED:0.54 eAED:0.54 QI:0/0/0/0.5/0/0/2/160/193
MKFMALLTANQQIPTTGNTTSGHPHTPRHNTRKTSTSTMRMMHVTLLRKTRTSIHTVNYLAPLATSSHNTLVHTIPPCRRLFPTKSTWLLAICKGNYSTWPFISVKNIHKHFPQSEETQQGHTRNQRKGIRSTKRVVPQDVPPAPLPQLQDIFILTYSTHNTLYIDQTGKFPQLPSQGNGYQMILYHVNSNSI